MWGIAACSSEVFFSDFSLLTKVCNGTSSTWGGDHDNLATNKLVEARTVFGHRVSSLVSGVAKVAAAVALGCCCSAEGLPCLG